MGMMGGWGWGWMPFGWFGMILMVLFWLAVILVLAYALRSLVGRPRGARTGEPGRDRALALLRERYARGEIDQAEYQERLRALNATPGTETWPN